MAAVSSGKLESRKVKDMNSTITKVLEFGYVPGVFKKDLSILDDSSAH